MYVKNLSASQAIAATGGGVDVDISAYQGKARFIFASLNTAGTLPTHDRKIQSSVPLAQSAMNQLSAGATDNQIKTSASVNTYFAVFIIILSSEKLKLLENTTTDLVF